jgi:signal transduction histidine kinase
VTRPSAWLSQWIYILAASLYFVAVLLRTWLFYNHSPVLGRALALLLAWLLLILSEPLISQRWRSYFPLYLLIQTLLVFVMLSLPDDPDFMAALLGVLSMQAMYRLPTWLGAAWIGVCAVLLGLVLWFGYAYQALALALIYTAGNVFLGSYTRTIRQVQAARLHNQQLAGELEQANQRLQDTSARLERLSAERERSRLARELHDSVTQTVFSMNLTTQSAALLLERDPSRVGEQLERLYSLARSALGEMQMLIHELKPDPPEGLPAALRKLLAESRFSDTLSVDLTVQGDQPVTPAEQAALVRIAQEALNNILKHAQTDQATIHVHLEQPPWLEISDRGQGFDTGQGLNPTQAQTPGRFGLASMRERAAEIGWELHITSSPGAGTCIRVEKSRQEAA